MMNRMVTVSVLLVGSADILQCRNEIINLSAGSNINTTGRLIKYKNLRRIIQTFCNRRFLLISTA